MIYIKQGVYSTMGKEIAGWTLHVRGQFPVTFRKLADAKAHAVERLGASGKWIREVHADGIRGAKRTRYVPLELAQKPAEQGGMKDHEIINELLSVAAASQWQTRHAAENRYCPWCHNEADEWTDQSEHHEGCRLMKLLRQGEDLVRRMKQA